MEEGFSSVSEHLFGDSSKEYSVSVRGIGNLKFQRRGHSVSQLVDGKIVVLGGECDESSKLESHVETLDGGETRTLCDLKPGVSFHRSCVIGNCIYVVGGFNGRRTARHLFRVSFSSPRGVKMDKVARLGKRIDSCSLVVHNGRVIIFGGWDGMSLRYNSTLEYTPLMNVVRKVQPKSVAKPRPRNSHSGVVFHDQMVIFGGYSGKRRLNDLWTFDFVREVWKKHECENAPSARSGHSVAVVGGGSQMLLIGGFTEKKTEDFGCIYLLDLRGFVWTRVHTTTTTACRPRMMLSDTALCKLRGERNSLMLVAGVNCYDSKEKAFSNRVFKVTVHSMKFLGERRRMMKNEKYLDLLIRCLI